MKIIELFESKNKTAVEDLKKDLIKAKKAGSKMDYDGVAKVMEKVWEKHNLTGQELHDIFVKEVGMIPDTWIKKQVDIEESSDEAQQESDSKIEELLKLASDTGNKMASSSTLQYQLYIPRKITNNEYLEEDIKPDAQLWTSTAQHRGGKIYTSAWAEWCYYNMPQWLSPVGKLYKIIPNAKILNIGSDKTAINIAKMIGKTFTQGKYDRLSNYPWEELDLLGIDAIRYPGRLSTHYRSRTTNLLMSLWDVESTAWYNRFKLQYLGDVTVKPRG